MKDCLKLTEVTSTKVSVYIWKPLYRYLGWSHFRQLNSKKIYEDEIFGWQDILQFFSGEFKGYKYVKFSIDVRGTLKKIIDLFLFYFIPYSRLLARIRFCPKPARLCVSWMRKSSKICSFWQSSFLLAINSY